MESKLLPIGSVITQEGSPSEIMIIGYYPIHPTDNKVFTYLGASYPWGIGEGLDMVMFQAESIRKVLFRGYCNDAVDRFCQLLELTVKSIEDTGNGSSVPKADA